MDSRYHNLPARTAKVEATATDTTTDIGNMVQRSNYHQSPHSDDMSSISDDRDDEETRSNKHEMHPLDANEKGPASAVLAVSHSKSINSARNNNEPIHQFQSRSMQIKSLAHEWWIFELGALAISYLSMLALVVVLKVCENKPIPRWPVSMLSYLSLRPS